MSTKSLESLERGLAILESLNRSPGIRLDTLSSELDIPRGTIYRLVETLRREGYVRRDRHRGRYSLDEHVLSLSESYYATGWLQDGAAGILQMLSKEFLWPATIAIPRGGNMVLCVTTDHQTPFVKNRYAIGSQRPILFSSTGLAYLAHCSQPLRDAAFKLLETIPINREIMTSDRRNDLEFMMHGIQKKGYAVYDHPDRVTQLAVPIFRNGNVSAGLSIKFFRTSMDLEVAAARFVNPLRQAARKISRLAPG
jgi:IclR family mhp operon transcriptional activator